MDKLKIIKGKKQGSSFKYNSSDSSSIIDICFNPTDYTVNKSNSYNEAKIPGLGSPIIQFNQGNAQSLSIKLLLDTQTNEKKQKEDVREKYIEKFEKLIKLDSDLHAPPPCKVLWGTLEFIGVCESLDKEYILFSSDGKPVRARVTLKFKEYLPLDVQVKEASLSSPDRRKLFTVKEGDSIWLLADKAYGDPGFWRVIAEANYIDNPRELELGMELIIPVLPESEQKK